MFSFWSLSIFPVFNFKFKIIFHLAKITKNTDPLRKCSQQDIPKKINIMLKN